MSMKNTAQSKGSQSPNKTVEIPVSKIGEGLRLCANNIRRFINDVRILLKEPSEWHAIASVIFAFEELAKYSELKKAKNCASQDVVTVDKRLFYSHKYKQKIAERLIPQGTMILSDAYFDPNYFDSQFFQTESVEASPRLRLDCVFVNWRDGHWVHGTPVIPQRIETFTEAILEALNQLESGST
jgi:AbiV family abortive infection protein